MLQGMDEAAGFHTTGSTYHALGFATGAALCIMMMAMQWRLARGGASSWAYLWTWSAGLLWNAGSFVWMMMLLAGAEPGRPPVTIAQTVAWISTCIGLVGLSAIFRNSIKAPAWLHNLLFGLAILTATIVAGLFWAVVLAPALPLSTDGVSILSFLSCVAFLTIYLVVLLLNRGDADVQHTGRGFLRVAIAIGAIQLTTIGLSIAFADTPFLRTLGSRIGAQWAIPWAIFAGAFIARTHYADLVLKRSLMLIASVAIAAVAVWLAGLPPGLAYVLTSLGIAGLMLATPALLRGVDWLIDRAFLRRPDYRELAREFRDAAGRAASPAELLSLALARIQAALHLEPRLAALTDPAPPGGERLTIPGATQAFDLKATTGARALLHEERTFLDAIAAETGRRLEALAFERERAERQLREERLQSTATQAELRALRAQVDPHFLFNTLNTISDLVSTDPAGAEAMTERLAEFFRYTLARQDRMFSTLDEELAFARQYLEIEQVRFGDRLRVEFAKADGLGAQTVPSLILQPLIENAVRHGLAPRREGGRVSISATRENGVLQLEVDDDGVGMPANRSATCSSGIGLSNVRARLQALYGDASSMSIGPGSNGRGARVRLTLPAA